MYEIAKHFTLKARRKAASLTYTESAGGKRTQPRARYEGQQCCPLGVMLMVDKKLGYLAWPTGAPMPNDVAACLIRSRAAPPAEGTRQEEAAVLALEEDVLVFVNHWDAQAIADLPLALGVEDAP